MTPRNTVTVDRGAASDPGAGIRIRIRIDVDPQKMEPERRLALTLGIGGIARAVLSKAEQEPFMLQLRDAWKEATSRPEGGAA